MYKLFIGSTLLIVIVFFSFVFRKQILKVLKPKVSPTDILKIPADGKENAVNILFLHHSTGKNIWSGGVEKWFGDLRSSSGKPYFITEQHFPFEYGNNPHDYWNIWVKHAGDKPWIYEPTLEMICRHYDVVVFKHCFPVSDIDPEDGKSSISSDKKTISNYKLQYEVLRDKLIKFKETKFIIWTGATLVEGATTPEKAQRAREFFNWVREVWDNRGDNIFLWDFQNLETEGGLFLLETYAKGPADSHPNEFFSAKVAPLLCQRIVDVVEGNGDLEDITGRQKGIGVK